MKLDRRPSKGDALLPVADWVDQSFCFRAPTYALLHSGMVEMFADTEYRTLEHPHYLLHIVTSHCYNCMCQALSCDLTGIHHRKVYCLMLCHLQMMLYYITPVCPGTLHTIQPHQFEWSYNFAWSYHTVKLSPKLGPVLDQPLKHELLAIEKAIITHPGNMSWPPQSSAGNHISQRDQ